MFEQTFTATQKTKRERAIVFALLAQGILVTGVGLLPLLGVEPLPPVKQFVLLPPVKLAPTPVEGPQNTSAKSASTVHRVFVPPSMKPLTADNVRVIALEPVSIPGPLTGGPVGSTGVPFGIAAGEIHPTPPGKPDPPVKPSLPVRLTSTIAQSQLIYGPKPAYSHLAVLSRSEGTVKLQAVISREGKIENLHVMSGPALLVGLAMDAVQNWRYRPLLLNGEPVEVITEIDVIFTLNH